MITEEGVASVKNNRIRAAILILVVAVAGLILLAQLAGGRHEKAPEADADLSAGTAYLQALEQQDPAVVDEALKKFRLQELTAERDEKLRQMQSGEISVWSLFEDYVIMGDSRAVGFTFLGALDDNRILAYYGDCSDKIPSHYQELETLNPSYIFLIYGLDDMLQAGNETPEAFTQIYLERLQDLQAHFPSAKIFVNPIFPCTDPAFDSYEPRKKWREAESYDKALENILRGTEFYYVYCDNITDYSQYWTEDGIHFNADFYKIWSENMIMAMYNAELGLYNSDGTIGLPEEESAP